MPTLPEKNQQIIQAHAALIVAVVHSVHNRDLRPQLEPMLGASAQNGWSELVQAIRKILNGQRDVSVLLGLDEEDSVIAEAILRGLQDPHSLPKTDQSADPTLAAPGLAQMIHAVSHGDLQALQWLGQMAEQMRSVGGDMSRVGAILRRLADGERDPDRLSKGMGGQGESLVLSVLEELGKLEPH